ncbi:MAG: GNAT family N-acetyltransferase [Parvibaculum sp.]|nr:GNAT family N-acetyltransferase [Parvibaculum sp.]
MSGRRLLHGGKVFLRRLEESDLERCERWINMPEIYTIMGVFGPRTRTEQEVWYRNISTSRTNLVYAVCLAKDGRHIGNLSLFDVNYMHRNAGVTVFIADEEHRSGGLGLEAVSLACEYAFDYLNMHKLHAKTDNPVAGKLYLKLGFVQEGVLRQQSYYSGKYVDKILFGLLRDEFVPAN